MAITLAEFILLGLLADWILRKFKIPGLVGMLLIGVILGPFVLNLVSPETLAVSSDLRLIALIVILLCAGLELSKDTLKRVGRTALLLSFVPAVFEGLAITALGPTLLGLTYMESAILGAVLSAVSPAVVVPLMIKFIKERKGIAKGIPTLILAASSIDDVFVIVIYSVLIGLYTGSRLNIVWKLAGIPLSIILGIIAGVAIGTVSCYLFRYYNPRATKRVLIIIGISIILTQVEHLLQNIISFSALLAVMTIGFIILEKQEHAAHELSAKFGKIWIFAEILLFALVGAQVNIHVAWKAGIAGTILIVLALVARSIGTYLCLLGTNLKMTERIFVIVSYLPKATVQAAIGGAPLIAMKAAGMNTGPGNIILAVAVLSILLTAPAGAWIISILGEKILETDCSDQKPSALTAVLESGGEIDFWKNNNGK